MSKAKVQREVESIKQKMVCKNTFRWGSFTEQEMQVLHEAGDLLYRLRNEEDRIKPDPTNPDNVLITVTDEQEKLLDQSLKILEG